MNILQQCVRWFMDLIWPGDYDKDSAVESYQSYLTSQRPEDLDAAIGSFALAVEQYRTYKHPSLVTTLINYAVAVRRRYDDFGHNVEDLDRVVSLTTEARDGWSGEKDTATYEYTLLVKTLADAYFDQYHRSVTTTDAAHRPNTDAFDNAVSLYTELKDNSAAASQRANIQIELGALFRMRCEHEKTPKYFDIGVRNLQEALKALSETNDDLETKARCLIGLAESHEVQSEVDVRPREGLWYEEKAIDYNRQARALLEQLGGGRPELPALLYNLARELMLRWRAYNQEEDLRNAREAAQAAKKCEGVHEALMQDINQLLESLSPVRGSTSKTRSIPIPKRRPTIEE